MTQSTEQSPTKKPPSKAIPNTLFTLGRARDERHRPLSGTAVLLYLLLSDLGRKGDYPPIAALAAMLGVHRTNVWRAEKALQIAGLLKLEAVTEGARRNFTYCVCVPDRLTRAQKYAWDSIWEPKPPPPPAEEMPETIEPESEASDYPEDLFDDLVPQPTAATSEPVLPLSPQEIQTNPDTTEPVTPTTTTAEPTSPPPKKLDSVKSEWFLQSADRMDLYIRFGVAAYGKTLEECKANLQSTNTDWLAFSPPDHNFPYDNQWKANHFMGYFWHGVTKWRATSNTQLSFPRWGQLAGCIKSLRASMTDFQAYVHIFVTINHFPLIRFLAGKIGETLVLNEGSLGHNIIRDQVLTISGHGEIWLQEQYDRFHEHLAKQQETDGG